METTGTTEAAGTTEMAGTGSGRIRLERDGVVVTIRLTGPRGTHAMSRAFFAELPQVVRALEADDDVRVVVLAGDGGSFSLGLDLVDIAPVFAGLRDPGVRERLAFRDFILDGQQAMRAVAACRKPTIAAIDGWCIGGGLGLAAACDVRIATTRARFSLREARMAVVADMGSLQWLAGIIGDGHLRQLALGAGDIDADRALRIGLVNDVYDGEDALAAATVALAAELSASSPVVLTGVKAVLEAERRDRVDRGLRDVADWNAAFLPSRDLAEAMAAFAEGRPPVFVGE